MPQPPGGYYTRPPIQYLVSSPARTEMCTPLASVVSSARGLATPRLKRKRGGGSNFRTCVNNERCYRALCSDLPKRCQNDMDTAAAAASAG
jgi:hypothetical protein